MIVAGHARWAGASLVQRAAFRPRRDLHSKPPISS